jgi:hypothetical protein
VCSVSRHPHDSVGSVETSPLTWDNACCCLCDRVSMTTSSFFFHSFLSFSFEIHIDHSKYHSFPLIYWYFNFDFYFFISNFCSLPFCQIPICFQFHHWIHNCDLLFFESDPYDLAFLFCVLLWIWFLFLIHPLNLKFLVVLFLKFQIWSTFSQLLFLFCFEFFCIIALVIVCSLYADVRVKWSVLSEVEQQHLPL